MNFTKSKGVPNIFASSLGKSKAGKIFLRHHHVALVCISEIFNRLTTVLTVAESDRDGQH